jgi:sec-independent protein translocase protein TatA
MGELIVILIIVMLVFGASRLPQLGEGVGKAIRNLKRGLAADDDIDVTPTAAAAAPADKQVKPESSARTATEEVRDAEVVER